MDEQICLKYDRNVTISTGAGAYAATWTNRLFSLSNLYTRLSNFARGQETLREYLQLDRATQARLKDNGGFVGGETADGKRRGSSFKGRDLITLDLDNMRRSDVDMVFEKLNALQCSYCVYSTRKHSPEKPRLRLIIPLDRTVLAEEYEPIIRKVADSIYMPAVDPTAFRINQLMYWPSCCFDTEVVYKYRDAPLLSADRVLASYGGDNWKDATRWPVQASEAGRVTREAVQKGDPCEKKGTVGAFCRCYTISAAIDTFLPGVYVPAGEDRYTFADGSTSGGAVVYDNDKFLYSHHATDPCSLQLVNAFDLVRLHKYGQLDTGTYEKITDCPSYAEMCKFAHTDSSVILELDKERTKEAVADFEGIHVEGNQEWRKELERDNKGGVRPTIDNVLKVLRNDERIVGKFAMNNFSGRVEVLDKVPWDTKTFNRRRWWTDSDTAGLNWFLETNYYINKRGVISDAFSMFTQQVGFDEVVDYLDALEWDGVHRLDTLLIDALGAADTELTRVTTRKMLVAAVARVYSPGKKFDNMLILSGPQGIGKSTLLSKLGRRWFNDSIRTFEGKEASELLVDTWIVEVAELDAFRKAETSTIKQFLSIQEDKYRPAYGRMSVAVPRRCVFFGTTNCSTYLRDATGNRRFWPVDCGVQPVKKHPWDYTDDEISQIWAEAKYYYNQGETLYLPPALTDELITVQNEHDDLPDYRGMVEEFARQQVPCNFYTMSATERRAYWNNREAGGLVDEDDMMDRPFICVQEVISELIQPYGKINIDARENRNINAILAKMPEYESDTVRQYVGVYGRQRVHMRRQKNA